MSIASILLVLLVVALLGGLPLWGHQGFGYGWYPSGGIGLIVLVLVILLLVGRI